MFTQCYVEKLKLYNFRNHFNFELDIGNKSIVIIGKNGVGKTNVLEAVSLLAKSNGMKKAKIGEIQNRFNNDNWAVHYRFFDGTYSNEIGIVNNANNKKLVQINGKVHSSLYKISNVIWLIPQMDHILLHSPSDRLKLLDRIASTFKENYTSCYMKYRKAKRERSKLLKNGVLDNNWFSILESIMSVNAIDILRMRLSVLEILQSTIDNHLSSSFPKANLKFSSQLTLDGTIEYHQNRLRENREKDTSTGRVNFGVHNDNFQIFCQKRNMPVNLCSTGEQKLLLLSVILSSAKARCLYNNKAPILLLDDIMSHLDFQHRQLLLKEVSNVQCQTWITDVNKNNFSHTESSFMLFDLEHNCY